MRSMERSGERTEITEVKESKMTVRHIADQVPLRIFSGSDALDMEVTGAYVSDLLSDVMGHASEGELWITLQSHVNVAAIASLKELAAVILVKGIVPDAAMLEKAVEEGIPVLGTDMSTYKITGMIYQALEN